MSSDTEHDNNHDELLFMTEQLHGTIVQNYTRSLQILGATLLIVSAVMGFVFSQDPHSVRGKAVLFLGAEALAIVGLMQSVDRVRSTSTMAAYLRVFVEPLLTHVKWESRLLEFRNRRFGRGARGFALGQWMVYVVLIGVNWLLTNDDG